MSRLERALGRLLRPIRAGETKLFHRRFAKAAPLVVEGAFADGRVMAPPYLGFGPIRDISPPLTWSGVPAEAAALALVIEDYDVPVPVPIVHGLAYWPADRLVALPEAALSGEPPAGLVVGRNSLGKLKYAGPRPISGHGIHHYVFQIFALRRRPTLAPGFGRKALAAAMAGEVLGVGLLTGTYERM